MGIHPKSIYKKQSKDVMGFYKKSCDEEILIEIKNIIKIRPSYGYKRVTAMVNKVRYAFKLDSINKKRVYRIMKMNGLILPKTDNNRTHVSTGKVMTLHSNTRWCSDCFEIKCFNGEKIYVTFLLDTCDREVISYLAKKEPILSQDIQELLLMGSEYRFGNGRPPRQIEFLSDRGAIYRAYNVQAFAAQLNFKSCFTAAYSPESNGMSEAFVKTMKRDYVYVTDCASADLVLSMIDGWFNDYNQNAPHSALGMKSPMEYRLAIN